jgi:hypothetical protein
MDLQNCFGLGSVRIRTIRTRNTLESERIALESETGDCPISFSKIENITGFNSAVHVIYNEILEAFSFLGDRNTLLKLSCKSADGNTRYFLIESETGDCPIFFSKIQQIMSL